MTKLTLLVALLLLPLTGLAQTGFVALPMGHELYADYEAPKDGKPTFVLVNGLVYDLDRWLPVSNKLKEQGFGVLRYYFRGQLKSLRNEAAKGEPKFFRDGLTPELYAQELSELMEALRIQKGMIVGLSYGAGIAAAFGEKYPAKVEKLFLLAPLVVSLDRYNPAGQWIQWNLNYLKMVWGPMWGPWVYDQYYDFIFRNFMRDRLTPEKIPAEMQNMAGTYKEAIFHQVRAMRDFDLRRYRFAGLDGRVNMFLASGEDAPALRDQFQSWAGFGSAQGNLIYLSSTWHAIPDSQGAFAAELLGRLSAQNTGLIHTQAYYATPSVGWDSLYQYSVRDLEAKAMREPREGNAAAGSPSPAQ